jgi:uncharacterized membrane protein
MEQLTHNQATQDDSAAHLLPAVCADCGAPLNGPFCSQCGEHVIDRRSLTLWHFINHNLLHELSHVDGKVFHTFRCLLFRPGFLSAEYFAGHRRNYINPVRLLLTCVVLAVLAHPGTMTMTVRKVRLSLLPPGPPSTSTIEETIGRLDVFGILTGFMEKEGRTKDLKSAASVEKFNHELKTYGTALSFCNVILLSMFLAVFYHHRRTLFLEHLVFSLHLASFVLVFSTALGPLFTAVVWAGKKLSSGPEMLVLQISTVITVSSLLGNEMFYLYRALLRFYQPDVGDRQTWRSAPAWITRLAVFAIFVANSVFITFTYAVGAAIALWRV